MLTHKYSIGDKVVVRRGLAGKRLESAMGGSCYFTHAMSQYAGTTVTIKRVVTASNHRYQIVEDGGSWFWTDEFFENHPASTHEIDVSAFI